MRDFFDMFIRDLVQMLYKYLQYFDNAQIFCCPAVSSVSGISLHMGLV